MIKLNCISSSIKEKYFKCKIDFRKRDNSQNCKLKRIKENEFLPKYNHQTTYGVMMKEICNNNDVAMLQLSRLERSNRNKSVDKKNLINSIV